MKKWIWMDFNLFRKCILKCTLEIWIVMSAANQLMFLINLRELTDT